MEIKKAEFIKGVVEGDQFWDPSIPQIVFYGRSNSGKSSSINAVLGRKALARPSGTPGKTREVNFYLVNNSFYVVDLPGYGYAKMSKGDQENLRKLILWFAEETQIERRIHVVVMDAKVGPTELDREMLEILQAFPGEQVIVLLNKTDKLNQKEMSQALKYAKEVIPPFAHILPFSAEKKKGVEEFWNIVGEQL